MKKKIETRYSRPPLARMLRLHEELQQGKWPNCRKLAEMLEVATKTIQRDLDFMRDQLNLPIEYDPHRHGYHYTEPVNAFPSVQVTEGEVMALMVAQKTLVQYRGTPFERPLTEAFRKLTEGMRDRISFDVQDWEGFYSFRSAGVAVTDLERFERLARGLQRSVRVRFSYRKLGSRGAETREVEPWHMTCVDQQWYLIGRDVARGGERTFALTRMDQVEVTDVSFKRPKDFSPAKLLQGSFGIFSGGKIQRVCLQFDAFAAQLVRERQWHPSQVLREQKNGGLELEMKLSSLPEIHRWVLSWGEHVRVMAPRVLQRMVEDSLRQALAGYKTRRKK